MGTTVCLVLARVVCGCVRFGGWGMGWGMNVLIDCIIF